MAILIPALAFLFARRDNDAEPILQEEDTEDGKNTIRQSSVIFSLLLIAIGALLILGPDFFYLRDNFGYRINTVFKFYYQAWQLLSIAVAFGVAVMFTELRGAVSKLYAVAMIVMIAMGLAYPVFSLPTKTNDFQRNNPDARTLDGSAYLELYMPEDYQTMVWWRRQWVVSIVNTHASRPILVCLPYSAGPVMKHNGGMLRYWVHVKAISKRFIQPLIGLRPKASSIATTFATS